MTRRVGFLVVLFALLAASCSSGTVEIVAPTPVPTVEQGAVADTTTPPGLTGAAEATPIPVEAAAAGEIFLEPAGSLGPDPFTGEVFVEPIDLTVATGITPEVMPAGDADTAEVEVRSRVGDEPGLYGGTRDNASCDAQGILDFLAANPASAAAWVGAQNADPTLRWGADRTDLTVEDLPAYFDELTPLVLTSDTRVTNHGYVDGRATPRQSVLQAGNAVLVDRWGVPRARCGCGNPLTPPAPVPVEPVYVGPRWPDFGTTIIIVIQPSITIIDDFVIIDVYTGDDFVRPRGTRGTGDRVASGVRSVAVAEPYPPTGGIGFDFPYDTATFTVYIDPAVTEWIAFSGADGLVDQPAGLPERVPDGVLDIVFPDVDDYLAIGVMPAGPFDENTIAETIIHDRDAMGTPIGPQSVIHGSFPSVWYVSSIDWTTSPPTSATVTGPEFGELTSYFDRMGAGEYTFLVEYHNKWTDRVAHGPLYLLIGEDGGVRTADAPEPAPVGPVLTDRFFADAEDAVVDVLVANDVPLDGRCGPDGLPDTYCWELYEERSFDLRLYYAVPQFMEAETIWILVGSGSAGWSVADIGTGVGPPF